MTQILFDGVGREEFTIYDFRYTIEFAERGRVKRGAGIGVSASGVSAGGVSVFRWGGVRKGAQMFNHEKRDRMEKSKAVELFYANYANDAIGLSTWLLRTLWLVFRPSVDDLVVGDRFHLHCLFQEPEEEFAA